MFIIFANTALRCQTFCCFNWRLNDLLFMLEDIHMQVNFRAAL